MGATGNTTFENAQRIYGGERKQTVITDGLLVSGMVTGKHLHQSFGTENLATINMGYAQIFSATNRYYGKPLVGMTEAKGKLKIINRAGFRWELSGGNAQRARVTGVACTDNRPGINFTTFDAIVDKPWFNVGDLVQPGTNTIRLRVEPSPGSTSRSHRQVGPNAFRYTFRIVTDNPNDFVPTQYLRVNSEWNRVSSAVATEGNIDGGGFSFYSIFEAQGQTQQHAIKVEVSDKVARRVKQASLSGEDMSEYGAWTKMLWVKYESGVKAEPLARFMAVLDAEQFNALYQDVENTLMFGKSSSHIYSPEGYQILTTSGLREQLESGWVLEHNGNMSLDELEDYFDSIMKDKISEGEQQVVLSAGREFRKMFDRMVKSDARGFLTLDTLYIRKGNDFRHLDYGSYFAKYTGFSVDIEVMENPAYDNFYYCPDKHPVKTNVTIDSYRADILDFGYSKQQGTGATTDNICMVAESYCDYHIRYNGKYYAHDGKTGMPITDGGLGQAGGVSGYSVQREKNAGLMVADVTRCGTIRLQPMPN